MKTLGFLATVYGILVLIVMVIAFVFVMPSIKQAQMDSCDMIQSGLQQINPQTPDVQPMTAQQCKMAVNNSWFVRGFIAVVGSMVVAALATPLALVGLYGLASVLAKKEAKEARE